MDFEGLNHPRASAVARRRNSSTNWLCSRAKTLCRKLPPIVQLSGNPVASCPRPVRQLRIGVQEDRQVSLAIAFAVPRLLQTPWRGVLDPSDPASPESSTLRRTHTAARHPTTPWMCCGRFSERARQAHSRPLWAERRRRAAVGDERLVDHVSRAAPGVRAASAWRDRRFHAVHLLRLTPRFDELGRVASLLQVGKPVVGHELNPESRDDVEEGGLLCSRSARPSRSRLPCSHPRTPSDPIARG